MSEEIVTHLWWTNKHKVTSNFVFLVCGDDAETSIMFVKKIIWDE